jgi:uncharacterized membrane protein
MERPLIKIKMTVIDYTVEIFALLLVVATIVLYVIYWVKAPEVVPLHYNIYGQADRYASKSALLILPIMSILLYVGLTILNKYPQIFNFPNAVTSQNVAYLYTTATRMVRWLKLLICLLFACIVWHEIKTIVINQTPEMNTIIWFLVAIVALYPVIPIIKMFRSSKK